MKKNILTLFFGLLVTAFVFLVGAIIGTRISLPYETFLIMILIAIASAAIGAVCTTPSKPKETKDTKKEDPKDVYSHTK